MINIQYKSTFRAITLTSVLLHCLSAVTIAKVPWYHNHFHALQGLEYRKNCFFINLAQHIRKAGLLIYYYTTREKANPEAVLCTIQQQLKDFKTWILELEEEALIAIKNKYGMSDEVWYQCLMDTRRTKCNNRKAMEQPHTSAIHDTHVPVDLMEILTTLLQKNNINPNCINIYMEDYFPIPLSPGTIGETTMFTFAPTMSGLENQLLYCIEYIPARMVFSKSLIKAIRSKKMSICAHEIQHLICQHSVTEIIVTDYLKHYCNVTKEEFNQSVEYKHLSQIHEAQAEILSAISDPKIARCMKKLRQDTYYPQHLYEEHFCHISTIDMLWNLHERFSALMVKTV
jgi:hypothetical protein